MTLIPSLTKNPGTSGVQAQVEYLSLNNNLFFQKLNHMEIKLSKNELSENLVHTFKIFLKFFYCYY